MSQIARNLNISSEVDDGENFYGALHTSETRSQICQSKPVSPILWINNKELEQIHSTVQVPFKNRNPEETPAISDQGKSSSLKSEESGLLGSSKWSNYLSADVAECDWEAISSRLAQARENPDCLDIFDHSKACRQLNIVLQTRQPLWIDFMKLRHLKDAANSLKLWFLQPSNSHKNPRQARNIEWRAKRGAIGIGKRKLKISDEKFKIINDIRRFFPDDTMATMVETGDTVDQLHQWFVFLKTRIFSGDTADLDAITPSNEWDFENATNAASDDERVLNSELRLLADISLLLDVKRILHDYAELERKILNTLEIKQPFTAGPVGENPIHTCLLLGLKDTGKRIIERFYPTPEQLNVPYANDLAPWRVSTRASDWDDGLYTGQTCLHIAIVQEDAELVEFLLERQASTFSTYARTGKN